MSLIVSKWLAVSVVAAAAACGSWAFFSMPPLRPQESGPIGAARSEGRRKFLIFRLAEPALVLCGAWVALLPVHKLRARLTTELALAGHWLGLNANELIFLAFVAGCAALAVGMPYVMFRGFPLSTGFLLFFLAAYRVIGSVMARARKRQDSVTRGLPPAIDLIALSMSAGADFPMAVRSVVETSSKKDPLNQEFGSVLRDMNLGRTREKALADFAIRIPVDAVQDLVASLIQAEKTGTPFVEAMAIQATVLRDKRQRAAEQTTAKAKQELLLPLAMLLASGLLLVYGPMRAIDEKVLEVLGV